MYCRFRRCALFGAVATALALVVLAPLAGANPLPVRQMPGVVFPDRTFNVSAPPGFPLTTDRVHVTENGRPVTNVGVASYSKPNPGRLGVILAIDSDWSMGGAPVQHAIAAARALAAQLSGNEELGVRFADGFTIPLTSDSAAIASGLGHNPRIAGLNLLNVTLAAVDELKAAHVARGAVIFLSDDIDRDPRNTPQSVGAYARAAHVKIFTVGILDDATYHPRPADLPLAAMPTMAKASGGTFTLASPAQLRRVVMTIEAGLTDQYLVSYRSSQPAGKTVSYSITVDGLGTYRARYKSPAPAGAPHGSRHNSSGPFWSVSNTLTLAALVSTALLGLAIGLLLARQAGRDSLRKRVTAFVPEQPEDDAAIPEVKTDHVTQLLSRRRWWPAFAEKVEIGRMKRSPKQLVYIGLGGSILTVVLLNLATGQVLLPVGAMLLPPLIVRYLVNRAANRQRAMFLDQLPGLIHETAGAMRTGRSLVEALGSVTGNADEPSRSEFESVLADERAGHPIENALRPIGERMQCQEIEQVAVVAGLHRRTGANITEVLDRVAETVRQRSELRREIRALTAQARMSRNILVALPPFVVIALTLIGGSFEKPLYNTTPGLILLVVCTIMVLIGARVMKAIVDIQE